MSTSVSTSGRADITEDARSGGELHPFDYYWREGMELRPAPSYAVPSPAWTPVRERLFSSWIDVREIPAETPLTKLAADHMWQGDELMDAVVAWFDRVGPGEGRAVLDLALDRGISAVDNPPSELVSLFEQLDNLPAWFDYETFEKGRLIWINATALGKSADRFVNTAITALGNEVGAATGATGRLEKDPVRRALETGEWFRTMTLKGAMDRFSEPFKDTVRVRLMHSQVRRGLKNNWGPEAFELFGNPISCTGMALGATSFGLTPVLYDHAFGRRCTRSDLDALAVYWGYITYIFGVAEEAIPKNSRESIEMADYIFSTMGNPPKWATTVSTAMDWTLRNIAEQNSIVKGFALRRFVFPLTYGLSAYTIGEPLTRGLLAGSPDEGMNLARWSKAARVLIGVSTWSAKLSDLLPGREERRERRAAQGDPFGNLFAVLTEKWAKKHSLVGVNYRSHDETTSADLETRTH